MSQEPTKLHGAFSWNELMTPNLGKAQDFYSKLFGWSMQEFHNNGIDYTIAKIGDRDTAGIMATPPGSENMPPAWGSYVTVANVDSMVDRVESLGGTICVPPRDIPDVGRFCVIADPQGAMLSLITYINRE